MIDNAVYNTVAQNNVTDNGGAGIVLVNEANRNTVQANTVTGNQIGILSTTLESLFPFHNQIIGNILMDNSVFDAADFDSQCNDYWAGNNVTRVNAEAVGCIQ